MISASVNEVLEQFFSRYRLQRYAKGQVLILSGEQPEHIFQLVKGRVKQYDVSYRGDELILNMFKPPAFFPMSLAINQTPNPYIFEAETDIEVRQIPAQEAVKFVKSNPDVLYDLLARVYRGTDGLLARLSHLMQGSARERLIHEVLIECRRFGEEKQDGSYTISVTESDLGARAGLSRETVSREMSKLKTEKLLKLSNGQIIVHDLSALEQKLTAKP